ncbi:hypothetical protein [Neisseria elongata]|uniref:hypothetical protein n=1 Tax=Neisseria elongata TaxID=495 RepID=UPI000E0DD76A|nr:hypothetical protein [Neisseria elongata]
MKHSIRSEARIIGQGRLKTKHPQRGAVRAYAAAAPSAQAGFSDGLFQFPPCSRYNAAYFQQRPSETFAEHCVRTRLGKGFIRKNDRAARRRSGVSSVWKPRFPA